MVAAAAAAEAANPGRRKEVQVIGGKETSVTILSDSEEPIQNGVAKAVPAVAPRRRAPVRAAAQAAAANAANANGNGTTSTSTRKRKVADDDSASVVGPASKRVVKVNGKAGVSVSYLRCRRRGLVADSFSHRLDRHRHLQQHRAPSRQ